MCSGGIHASGSLRSASNSLSHSASWRSVFARRFRPRSARVSTVSARCATAPARSSARATNSQPEHASIATCTSRPQNPATHSNTAAGVDAIRPRLTSPVNESTASKVICRRCTSNPTTTAPANGSGITCATSRAAFRATDDIPSFTVGTSSSNWPAARLLSARAFDQSRSTRRTDHLPSTQPRRPIKGRSCHLRRPRGHEAAAAAPGSPEGEAANHAFGVDDAPGAGAIVSIGWASAPRASQRSRSLPQVGLADSRRSPGRLPCGRRARPYARPRARVTAREAGLRCWPSSTALSSAAISVVSSSRRRSSDARSSAMKDTRSRVRDRADRNGAYCSCGQSRKHVTTIGRGAGLWLRPGGVVR
jgi:hypothetical protein